MCGIGGIVTRDGRDVRSALARMMDAQSHRGPDDSGTSCVQFGPCQLHLGHRRLSILDLSAAGHQPMVHPETADQIVFNGEIYNFRDLRHELEQLGERLVGHSDTEVLLRGLSRFGADYLKRLQGMFAFAFYDARRQQLLLARDSIGIKPLYIADTGRELLFASEVRALLATGLVDRQLDPQGVAGLLAYGAVQHPSTLFRGIRSFPPGYYQIIPADAPPLPPVRYWNYPAIRDDLTEDRILPQLRATLEQAVVDHLVADVPVAVFLSSGIDSTVIAGLAARHAPRLRSFTVAFAEHPDLSEGGRAAETARQFGLQHTDIQISGTDAQAAFVRWLRGLDQPSLDGLNTYVISGAVKAQGITVALSGLGGDELFGGYKSFRRVTRLRHLVRAGGWLPATLQRTFARAISFGRTEAFRQKMHDILSTDGGLLNLSLQMRRVMSGDQLAALGITATRLHLLDNLLPPEALADFNASEADPVALVSQAEARFYMGNMLLRDSDTNGMAHSLEIRVPFLDQRVIDLVTPLPGSMRLPPGSLSKHLLRQAFPELLPPHIISKTKMGFSLPIRQWMHGPLNERCEHAVEVVKNSGLLRPQGVEAIWSGFQREPGSAMWSRALTLCVLGEYLDSMAKASDPPPYPVTAVA